MDEGETASSMAAMTFRDSSLPSLSENRRYGRCSRKVIFFVTLLVVSFITMGAIIATLASAPNGKVYLVVGGSADGGATDTVELLGLTSETRPRKLGKFPKKISSAVGTTLDGVPHICGGDDENGNDVQECWAYNAGQDEWSVSGSMSEARSSSEATSHPDHGWVITGGYPYKSSAEHTRDGHSFQTAPDLELPLGLREHCLVSLDGGDSGDFFLTGGDPGIDYNKKTYIFRQGGWRPVKDMPTGRRGLMCGTVRSRPGGPVQKVVAAGGDNGNYLTKVEIYDLKSNTWTTGTDLPVGLNDAAVVPFETTFLIIGGDGGDYSNSDKVYHYTTDGDWEEMPHLQLSEGKQAFTAMIVPSSLFD